jgi:STE24 endopeptidase
MKLPRVLLGLGAGFAAGYCLARTLEAAREWSDPAPPANPKDAATYAKARRALEVADTLRGIAGLVTFAHGGLASAVDRGTSRAPVWLRPALYVTPLLLLSSILDLPVSFIQDYTLERRYALSEQSRQAWLADYAKSSMVSTALTAFVATLFGFAVRRAPKTWPLWASAGALPLFVVGNLIVPLYVLPLFNTFEPLTGPLEARLRKLAARFGVGDAEILRMDMSRQTRKANAFVVGIGQTHRIVLGDTLIDAFPEGEIEFVVAHELGHYVRKDTWRLIGVGELLAALLFVIANATTPRRERDDLRERPLLIARFYATMLVATQALRPLLFAFSRSREWAADHFALDATHDAPTGAAAFRRLRDLNLADEDPPGWYEFFFSSHPSLKARIAALEDGQSSS